MAKRIIIIEDDGQPGIGVNPYEGLFDNNIFTDPMSGYPCATCLNNPQINPYASGFCNCTLPDMWMHNPNRPRIRNGMNYTTYTTNTFGTTDFTDNINLYKNN